MTKEYEVFKGDDKSLEIQYLKTGVPQFDEMLGWGLPRGRIVEFYGQRKSGKTTFSLAIMSENPKSVFIDAEKSFDPGWAKTQGVDLSGIEVVRPLSGEGAINAVLEYIDKGYDLIVLDSVASLVTRSEIENENSYAPLAKLMNSAVKLINLANTNTCVVFLNQLRKAIGKPFSVDNRPGGVGLDYIASLIVKFTRVSNIKKSTGEEIGIETRVVIEKNKLASVVPPMRYNIKNGTIEVKKTRKRKGATKE